jgi:hypothetical protein
MQVVWDLLSAGDVEENFTGITIKRGCRVEAIPISAGSTGTDPGVVLSGLGALPSIFDQFPVNSYNYALLHERNLVKVWTPDSVQYLLIYRGIKPIPVSTGGASTIPFSVEDSSTITWIETYASADESKAIVVAYKAGGAVGGPSSLGPAYTAKAMPVRKMLPSRLVKATASINAADWNTFSSQAQAYAGSINSQPWGSGGRGDWLFPGPVATTRDFGHTYTVECSFLEAPTYLGWYPLLAWRNTHGNHPSDCDPTNIFTTPPAANSISQGNGITMCSVYREKDFNSLFSFSPS